eukprot:Nitzschia sp. Nitz4//scaffold10_size219509//151320//152594//NITZ4_001447-RA/size219509-processed-gene-0.89-mRNA-1//1//CDS//3329532977//386//frame0
MSMGNLDSIDNEDFDDLAHQIEESLNLGYGRPDNTTAIDQLANKFKKGKVKNVLILCGAGVSVSAGIPDFRTPGTGLYDNLAKYDLPYPQAIFDVEFYAEKPEAFCTLAQELWPGLTHSPTLTHSFLKLLSDKGLLLRNYSQNIDGLEHLAGIPSEQLVECHGHFRSASCIECHKEADAEKVKDLIVKTGKTPICTHCGGFVKPDIVFFGESLPSRFHNLLPKDVKKADLLLILGTSLQVAPVSMIPDMVRCPRVLINREKVLSMKHNDLFLEGDCDESIEQLCEKLGWTEDLIKQNNATKISKKIEEKEKNSEEK